MQRVAVLLLSRVVCLGLVLDVQPCFWCSRCENRQLVYQKTNPPFDFGIQDSQAENRKVEILQVFIFVSKKV